MDTSRVKESVQRNLPTPSGGGIGGGGGGGDGTSQYFIGALIIGALIGNMFAAKRLKSFEFVKASRYTTSYKPAAGPWQAPSPSNNYFNEHIDERNFKANVERGTGSPGGSAPYPPSGRFGAAAAAASYKNSNLIRRESELAFIQQYRQWKMSGFPASSTAAPRPVFTSHSSSSSRSSGIDGGTDAFLASYISKDAWASYLSTLQLPAAQVPSRTEVKDAYRLLALRLHPDTAAGAGAGAGAGSVPSGRDKGGSKDKEKVREEFSRATDAYRTLLAKLADLDARVGAGHG
jgi:hypothetical protein